jgi:hybrid cluster-associated redox disulfide protein
MLWAIMMLPTVTANNTIAEILARRPNAARLFIRRGMHCVGCAMARFETLAEACATYGISTDELLQDLKREEAVGRGGSTRRRRRRVGA